MNVSVKQRLVAIARAARVLPLAERLRYLKCRAESAADNRRFLDQEPDFIPPPLWWMHDMYRQTSYCHYWRTGRETANAISEKIEAYVASKRPRVTDWGCGLARVVRHLPEGYARFGFDYNAEAIRWCTEHIAGVRFAVNGLSPPLPTSDGAFDALYALSVFTHLSAEGHRRWIAEIERVLAPGGIFLGAFHMRPEPGQLLPAEQKRFDAGELVVRGGVKEGSRNFVAYHPETYLRGTLLRNFDILEDPSELFRQTLFVARKR